MTGRLQLFLDHLRYRLVKKNNKLCSASFDWSVPFVVNLLCYLLHQHVDEIAVLRLATVGYRLLPLEDEYILPRSLLQNNCLRKRDEDIFWDQLPSCWST